MSKNIVIQEGGLGKQLTADKLKTNLVSGGTCLWVPEDGTRLGTKYITENGTYRANDEGLYGYSEVTVSGIGTATGTGPDGEDHSYSEDGSGGVTDTILPYSISVVTPPTKIDYVDGATIDFSGMVVKGYLKAGGLWTDSSHPDGVIPISELLLPVTTVDSSTADDRSATSDIVSGSVPTASRVSFHCDTMIDRRQRIIKYEYTGVAQAVKQTSDIYINLLRASANPSDKLTYHALSYWADTGEYISNTYEQWGLNSSYTHDGKTVYYGIMGSNMGETILDLSLANAPAINGAVAWTIVYGNITGGTIEIPVQWLRSDGKTLESGFNINVA